MGRIRTIKPQFFTSEDVTAQPVLARLLFAGLFTEADRDGRVEDRPRQLKTRLLPEDDCDVDALLWSLVAGRLIRRYEADGVAVIQILAFGKHQRPHPKEAASILPKDGTDRTPPCNSTIDRERVSVHPVEHPSCPPFEGREGVSLREGEREGNGARSRTSVQGSGAFEPNSLPRDHMRHTLCGPSMRICLVSWQYNVLEKAYNDPDSTKARVVISQFIEQLESGLSPESSIGAFSWVEKEFQTYLKSIGRTPPSIKAVTKPFSASEAAARELARRAAK